MSDWGLFQGEGSPHADDPASFLLLPCPGLPVIDPVPAMRGFNSSAKEGSKMKSLLQILIVSAVSFLSAVPAAFASPPAPPLPEPETLGLVAIGAVALLVSRFRKRK